MGEFGEPWKIEVLKNHDADYPAIIDTQRNEIVGDMIDTYATRAVAAVNACAGLPLREDVPVGAVVALVAAVRDLTWSVIYDGEQDDYECISCGAFQRDGHRPGCQLAAALAALTGDDA